MSGQKSPSVNNLISFWSDLESPDPTSSGQGTSANPNLGGFQPARLQGPQSILNLSQSPPVGASPHLTSPASTSPQRSPLPPNSIASSPSLLTPIPKTHVPAQGSAPLFPLRSVAPAQTRVFGTQRHALDTINARPLQSPPVQSIPVSNRPSGPRAAHHNPRPHPIWTTSSPRKGGVSSSPASGAINDSALGFSGGASRSIDTKPTLKPVENTSAPSSASLTPNRRVEGFHPSARGASVPNLSNDSSQRRDLQQRIRPKAPSSYTSSPSASSVLASSSALQSIPSSAPLSPSSEGILKLAVIPPVQTKTETLKKHHHLARSHPLVSNSEPLGRPIDVLLPLSK